MDPSSVERSCISCRIARGEIPASVVLDTPEAIAFLDKGSVDVGGIAIVVIIGIVVFGVVLNRQQTATQADGVTTTEPGAPVIDNIELAGASARVTFDPPANGGAAITRYEYRLDGGTWTDTGRLLVAYQP